MFSGPDALYICFSFNFMYAWKKFPNFLNRKGIDDHANIITNSLTFMFNIKKKNQLRKGWSSMFNRFTILCIILTQF